MKFYILKKQVNMIALWRMNIAGGVELTGIPG